MKRFNQIAIPDGNDRITGTIERFQPYSKNSIRLYHTEPASEEEYIKRSKNADCLLISWSAVLTGKIISACAKLEYIGLAATLFTGQGANIDLETASARNITVKGVSDYGDVGVVEFVLSEVIQHIKNGDTNTELSSHNIGIIGFGNTGSQVARALKYFGANVFYYSRNRKSEINSKGIAYLPIDELLRTVDILSIHVPRNTIVLTEKELALFTHDRVIINTSVGLPVEKHAMQNWLLDPSNRLIADRDGIGYLSDRAAEFSNIRLYPRYAGFTAEAQDRLINKVESNIIAYLKSKKS